jgi:DNA repair/transcription protein MET18/MMS19
LKHPSVEFIKLLDINIGETTLLDVVKALGEYLTSEEDGIRAKGM